MENKDHKIQKIHKIAFIYCIKSYQTDKVYIGSTAQRLSKRLSQHKSRYKAYLNDKYHYLSSFEIVKYDDCYIEMIETLNDVNKMEIEKIEGTYIKNMDCINKFIAGRTKKEHYNDNKQQIIEHIKQYYNDNKQKILEKQNQKHNCLCGGKYTTIHKSKHEKTQKHLNYIKK